MTPVAAAQYADLETALPQLPGEPKTCRRLARPADGEVAHADNRARQLRRLEPSPAKQRVAELDSRPIKKCQRKKKPPQKFTADAAPLPHHPHPDILHRCDRALGLIPPHYQYR